MRNIWLRTGGVFAVGLLAALAWPSGGTDAGLTGSPRVNADAQKKVRQMSAQFTENKGQWNSKAKFLFRSGPMDVWITGDGMLMDFRRADAKTKALGQRVGMSFEGANPGHDLAGEKQTRLLSNYLATSYLHQEHDVRGFSEVLAGNLYAGVDARYYLQSGRVRYDLIAHPNANTGAIKMKFRGADGLKVDKSGNLVVQTQVGDQRFAGLYAYQMVNGQRKQVSARFKLVDKNTAGFGLGAYDKSKTLTIDPIVYGSYYGGDDGLDEVHGVVSDTDGAVFIAGWTQSPRFPVIFGPYYFQLNEGAPDFARDGFISKFQGDVYFHDYASFIGGEMTESVDSIAKDPFGNIWIGGKTESVDFPGNTTKPNVWFIDPDTSPEHATGGTFDFEYLDEKNSIDIHNIIPWNATAVQVKNILQGNGIVVTSTSGGPLSQLMPPGTIRVELPISEPGFFRINNRGLRAKYKINHWPTNSGALLIPNNMTAGTFKLIVGSFGPTGNIAFNASAATVRAAIQAVVPANIRPFVEVFTVPTSNQSFPTGTYLVRFNPAGFSNPPAISVDATLLTGGLDVAKSDQQEILTDPNGSVPSSGTFTVTFNTVTSPLIPWNASSLVLEGALAGTTSFGTGNVTVQTNPGGGFALPINGQVVAFIGTLAGTIWPDLIIDNSALHPQPVYTDRHYHWVFLQRWAKSGNGLDPLPTKDFMIGNTDNDNYFGGIAIKPVDNPQQGDPVNVYLAGSADDGTIPEINGQQTGTGFLLHYIYSNGTLSQSAVNSGYLPATARVKVSGLAVDREGSVYLGGTVYGPSNAVDTRQQPGVFQTTSGIFQDGWLLRSWDLFVRKYREDGSLVYSALVGGNGEDVAAGDYDLGTDAWAANDGTRQYMGSCVAVDGAHNAYLAGISRSFNFPRTRGVFGEVFDANPVTTVTKINTDASQIVYSTNLKSTGPVHPSGIAVTNGGEAVVTGVVDAAVTAWAGPLPGSIVNGTVSTTTDGQQTFTTAQPPQIPTTDGWINVVNATGTNLLFGSYIGGANDDRAWGPYVDSFGDVWVTGYTTGFRIYFDPLQQLQTLSGNMNSFTTPLAFKSSVDVGQTNRMNALWAWHQPGGNPFVPQQWGINYAGDGFVLRYRIGLPVIQSVALNPANIPGGLGASSVGTVTLSQAAPSGGIDITVSLSDTNTASFDPTLPVGQITVNIPGGQQTASFTVYSSPVSVPTDVDVKAEFEENFRIARLTVSPWLSSLSLTPTQVVGGNVVVGRVRLFRVAAQDITVDLSSDNPSLVTFPGGPTVVVPTGQDTATFQIQTSGVATQTVVNISASLLGVGRSQPLTINSANLLQLSFNPPRVTGETDSTGTLRLDGAAGTAFTVNLTLPPGAPPEYRITPSTLTFNPGDTQKTFVVHTQYEPANTQRVITATRPAQGSYSAESTSAILFVDAADLLDFSIAPSTVNGGQTATGTVTINRVAGDGGTVIHVTSNNPAAQVPPIVTVPAGQTQVAFDITTSTNATNQIATITASRGTGDFHAIQRTLTINKIQLGFTIDPNSVRGGLNTTGTVTLNGPAPAGGLTVNFSSDNGAAQFYGGNSILIPAGQTSGTVLITTSVVSTTTVANLTASYAGGTPSTATLTIRPVLLTGITFTPPKVRGGQVSHLTVTLDGPAPQGGIVVTLTNQNPNIANIPAMITIPQGASSATITVSTRRVSRSLSTQVTASYGGVQVTGILTVLR